jgi:hypothetical protein
MTRIDLISLYNLICRPDLLVVELWNNEKVRAIGLHDKQCSMAFVNGTVGWEVILQAEDLDCHQRQSVWLPSGLDLMLKMEQ